MGLFVTAILSCWRNKYNISRAFNMRYKEFKNIEPQIGDIVGVEFGDTLIETVIVDLRDDGVVIALDRKSVDLLSERVAAVGFGDPYMHARYDQDVDVEPETKPNAQDVGVGTDIKFTAGDCKNALDWGLKTIEDFPLEIKNQLKNSVKGVTLEYLLIVARRSNAYEKNNFSEEELKACQPYLSYATNNQGINTWDDVVGQKANENQQPLPASQRMRMDDYIKQAEEIQQKHSQAIRANNKELASKFEKERDLLDAQARRGLVTEAEYQGRKVQLGKPMKGDVKKSKVYVRGPKGNVVKVNFGDPNMKIKKSNPKRRKSFRARHNCDNPGPRWKARYWSCRAW